MLNEDLNLRPLYFITGASGFVGRNLCKKLRSLGYEVRAIVRAEDAYLSSLGVKLLIGDLWDKYLIEQILHDVNYVVHCAGNANFGNGSHYFEENLHLTEYLIDLMKNLRPEAKLIYVSTIGAVDRDKYDSCSLPLTEDSEPHPQSDYGKSKLLAEEAIKLSGLVYTIIRPTMVIGSDMRSNSHFSFFAGKSISGSLFAKFAWQGELSVIHVEDLASALLFISTNSNTNGCTYFCAGAQIKVADFFKLCNPNTKLAPLTILTLISRIFVSFMPFPIKVLTLPALTASDARLRSLGWAPQYSTEEALMQVIVRERARRNPGLCPGGQTVITGAASGLGRSLALYLSPRRERLLLIDKDEKLLTILAGSLDNCTLKVVDLSSEMQVDQLLDSHEWNQLRITELYVCAGLGNKGSMQSLSIQKHREMFAVNVLARIALIKRAIASMCRDHFGRIIIVSSSSAFQPLPYMATYAATNSALLSLGESWAKELKGLDLQIMTVCPGGMDTSFQKAGGVKEVRGEKLMSPDDVVVKIMKGLRRNKTLLIISFRSFAMSILARILPRNLSVDLWGYLMSKMR